MNCTVNISVVLSKSREWTQVTRTLVRRRDSVLTTRPPCLYETYSFSSFHFYIPHPLWGTMPNSGAILRDQTESPGMDLDLATVATCIPSTTKNFKNENANYVFRYWYILKIRFPSTWVRKHVITQTLEEIQIKGW